MDMEAKQESDGAVIDEKIERIDDNFKETGIRVGRLEALQDIWEARTIDHQMQIQDCRAEIETKVKEYTRSL